MIYAVGLPKRFVRFRADPALVRVSIRWWTPWWRVTITERDGIFPKVTGWSDPNPEVALALALAEADRIGMPGLNLDQEKVFPHPHFGDAEET